MRTDDDIKQDVEYELKWDPDIVAEGRERTQHQTGGTLGALDGRLYGQSDLC
ncbi:hypothetical protein AWB75_06071 [Caballeronia catudaia]|uniref:Uncharacterized protein n=1 Tax=Caballeronia catudaia TaxID=1777136 RepID=A0A158D265_9BURK|nr:hypothetical protein AWB75_06071 [Caballeronia catudaia]